MFCWERGNKILIKSNGLINFNVHNDTKNNI